jgi:hypothetical protein
MQGTLSATTGFEDNYLRVNYKMPLTQSVAARHLFRVAWAIKPVYGWLTDNFNWFGLGYRRPWTVVGTLIGGAAFAALPSFQPSDVAQWGNFLFLVFLRSAGIAQADAATDGLLVDADVGALGSISQGVMNSGRNVGEFFANMIGGAIVTGTSPDQRAFISPAFFYFLAAGVWVATPFAFLVREERLAKETFDVYSLRAFLLPAVIACNVWNVFGQIGDRCASVALNRWASGEHGMSTEEQAQMQGVAVWFGVAGCMTMGFLFDKCNRRTLLVAESLLFTACNLVQVFVNNKTGVWVFWLANSFAGGVHVTALNRMIFLLSPRNSAGTFLAINSMIGHLSMMTGEQIGVDIQAAFGIRASFIAGAVLTGVMLVPAYVLTSPSLDPVTRRLAHDAKQAARDAKARELGLDPADLSKFVVVVPNPLSGDKLLSSHPINDRLAVLMAPGQQPPGGRAGGEAPWSRESCGSEAAFLSDDAAGGGDARGSSAGGGGGREERDSRRSATVEQALRAAREASLATPQRAPLPAPRDKQPPLGAVLQGLFALGRIFFDSA